ncbi:response regulator containing CheY-like receiver domain and AraC-type DNA-binding domain [Thermobacillus composti KWC4]|uniref:Response regulator containing CheY-like receiver domain and AraC-type DNA-binding domain n=1 Tax=Thermobacillus composti (strain DSM 18247 / JCM 13945 / KWC4) TaxID=717605 RepID=L0ECR0_THECK|nr:response regulator [Thermobacillus composti]AGA57399.1 response regulator containing CheY-like receiver domain and AraC-type DNA-binding domain [Thermobacillus composti KWC4]
MKRILIVDDEPIIRLSLAKKAGECDPSAVVAGVASDGREALDWLENHYADLCITDVKMPVMNGLELIRAIRERHPWMGCIVVSSYDDFDFVKRSLELDVIDYVLKPVDSDELKNVMAKAFAELEGSRRDEAARLLIGKIPLHRDMLDRWEQTLDAMLAEQVPLLIVDTLAMMEQWTVGRLHLLPELAGGWLDVVHETLLKEARGVPEREPDVPENIRTAFETLSLDRIRTWFRLCAAGVLEQGGCRLIEQIAKQRSLKGSRLATQVKEYVDRHYAERITLQDVADALCISRTYLASQFKQETGMTFLNYLVSVRMERARELLLNTPMKVYEITMSVGYENTIHFSKLFKEYYGLNPMEYKKRMGG